MGDSRSPFQEVEGALFNAPGAIESTSTSEGLQELMDTEITHENVSDLSNLALLRLRARCIRGKFDRLYKIKNKQPHGKFI